MMITSRGTFFQCRLTLCNLSIEMGARGGFVAPDETTFAYLKGKPFAPKGEEWERAVAYWKTLKSGDDAVFDKELTFDGKDIEPRVTYGTNPGMGIGITECIPTLDSIDETSQASFKKSLQYMGFEAGTTVGQANRLCFLRSLYQRTNRRFPCFCFHRERSSESGTCDCVARTRQLGC